MRILAITNMYPTPQAPFSGNFVEQQIKGLRQIGLDVDVLFVDRGQKGMGVYMSLGGQIQVRVKRFQPDIVHAMYGGVMAGQVTRAVNDRPTVITFHGSDLLGERLSGVLRKLIAGYGVGVSWKAARRASGIVVVSKALREALPQDLNRPITVIPCGIDLKRFTPLNRDSCCTQLGWNTDRFHVLFPSTSGDPVKRPALARSAVEAANRMGISAEIHYLRGVPNSEVPVWINASDVVLLTSLHEGSPTIIKEALACNLPIVSVDVGDVGERIQGIKGCYLASSEPVDLANKLRLVHGGLRRVEGRVKMHELSLECVAVRLRKFYSQVLLSFEKERYNTSY
jgi:teichuronic acid biosynthesis glycosyltransferase TuaC